MARKELDSNAQLNEDNRVKIVEAIGDLLTEHADEVNKAIQESDDKKITVNFAVEIDGSDSATQIDIRCRFTPCTVTDKRTLTCDDPKQGKWDIFTPEQLKQREAAQAPIDEAQAKADKATAKAEKKAKKAADKAKADADNEGAE